MKLRVAYVVFGFLSFVLPLAAQTPSSSSASVQAPPPLIQFSSVAGDESGTPLSGVVNMRGRGHRHIHGLSLRTS